MGRSRNDLSIRPAALGDAESVLRLALRSVSAEQQQEQIRLTVAALRSGAIEANVLLEACRGQRRVGAIYGQTQPGRSAVLWPPALVRGEAGETAGRLLDELLTHLSKSHIRIAQVVLEVATKSDDALLGAHGFKFLANLLYLVSLEIEFPRQGPPTMLAFREYCQTDHDRLAALVEATYEQTQDCAGLDGLRDMSDVLAGYRAAGTFNSAHWLFVEHEGRDVGCLLLADYPEQGNMELVYMGLIPSARGSGWGRHIVRRAQWLARRAGRPRLVLAVDAVNRPAIQVYAASGFQAWDRRTVYLKRFTPDTAD